MTATQNAGTRPAHSKPASMVCRDRTHEQKMQCIANTVHASGKTGQNRTEHDWEREDAGFSIAGFIGSCPSGSRGA